MATLSDMLPFQVNFYLGKDNTQSIRVKSFCESEEEFYSQIDQSSFELKENIVTKIEFTCTDNNARLYMYGLESIPSGANGINVDHLGEAYLSANEGELLLFESEHYPLIPHGRYQLIVDISGRKWYAPFSVRPKQVSIDQLEIMKQQLESRIRGLAFELISRRMAKGDYNGKSLPPLLYMKFMIIKNHFDHVMTAISDLYAKANFRIQKEYRIVRTDKANLIDEITIRHQLKHPELQGFLKVPVRNVDYNLPENIWIKQIVQMLLSTLNDFVVALENHVELKKEEVSRLKPYLGQENTKKRLNKENETLTELMGIKSVVARMIIGFQLICSAHWYDQVKETSLISVPLALTRDSRYRSIYDLHVKLQQENIKISIDPLYSIQWKRTDKLYEMWGYVEILRILEEHLGFNPIKGWIYDQAYSDHDVLIPTIPNGGKVVFTKDDLQLQFIYDGVIPLESKKTEQYENPLYMLQSHNRPDGRIDLYKSGIYCGTLMIDFKYRPKNNIWDKDKVNLETRPNSMKQLIAYGHSGSDFLYVDTKHPTKKTNRRKPNPISEVWVCYPLINSGNISDDGSEDHNVYIVPLIPGDSNLHIATKLQENIQNMILAYEESRL